MNTPVGLALAGLLCAAASATYAVPAAYAAPPAVQTADDAVWREMGQIAARNLERHVASREATRAMLEGSDWDPEMKSFLTESLKQLDRQIARDQEWIDAAAEAEPNPKADAVSGPLRDWLAAQDARAALDAGQAERLDGAPRADSALAYNRVKADGTAAAAADGRFLQRWTTVVVDSTGEVIVNDPRDQIEARLDDISNELDQLTQDARTETDPVRQRDIRDRLTVLDRDLRNAMRALSRMLESIEVSATAEVPWTGEPICTPHRMNLAVMGCDYWGINMPLIIPGGDPIIIEKVKLEIAEEDLGGRPARWSLLIWSRYRSDRRPILGPTYSQAGEIAHLGGGAFVMNPGEFADIDAGAFPLTLTMHEARATGVDLIDRFPLNIRFQRDASNFVELDPDNPRGAEQPPRDTAYDPLLPLEGRQEDSGWSDDDLVPLTGDEGEVPAAAWSDDDLVPLADDAGEEPAAMDDDDLVPLVSGAPETPPDGDLIPLVPGD